MPQQDLLLLVLGDEESHRDSEVTAMRARRAQLDPAMRLGAWDSTAKVTFDRTLLNELVSMRFVASRAHVAIVGPAGVGKTFLAHALGHIACRHGHSALARRTDQMLKVLRHARLDQSYEVELRKLLAVDVLLIDDFGVDAMAATEGRDAYEIFTEWHRAGTMIVTSNRGPDEWLATFAGPVRAQSAIDRFMGNSYDLLIDGESYRPRQKPRLDQAARTTHRITPGSTIVTHRGARVPPIQGHDAEPTSDRIEISRLDKKAGGRTSSAGYGEGIRGGKLLIDPGGKVLKTDTQTQQGADYSAVLEELNELALADDIPRDKRRWLLQIVHSFRMLDTVLARLVLHHGIGDGGQSLGNYLSCGSLCAVIRVPVGLAEGSPTRDVMRWQNWSPGLVLGCSVPGRQWTGLVTNPGSGRQR
jgi:DNA replication protein DnaC